VPKDRLMPCEVLPLFSKPLYISEADEKMPNILGGIDQFTYNDYGYERSGTRTDDQAIVHYFPAFKDWLSEHIAEYCFGLQGIDPEVHKVEITASWINIYPKGCRAKPHVHNNAMYSGNVFLQCSSGNLIFENPYRHQYMEPTLRDMNLYNSTQFTLEPKNSVVCIFPADVVHYTEPNESDEDRITLSFNLFVRGNPIWPPQYKGVESQ
tara:strand:- start:9793 stop:10419 length:627 start_codon:yes stop_codon:yes gene_type:complete